MNKCVTAKKRPCRICKKWFQPNARVGDRQKTCGSKECKRKWHNKKCTDWNKNNKAYFKAIYLSQKLDAACVQTPARIDSQLNTDKSIPLKTRLDLGLPKKEVQEVMGIQFVVIIEYVAQLLFKRFKEVMPP